MHTTTGKRPPHAGRPPGTKNQRPRGKARRVCDDYDTWDVAKLGQPDSTMTAKLAKRHKTSREYVIAVLHRWRPGWQKAYVPKPKKPRRKPKRPMLPRITTRADLVLRMWESGKFDQVRELASVTGYSKHWITKVLDTWAPDWRTGGHTINRSGYAPTEPDTEPHPTETGGHDDE